MARGSHPNSLANLRRGGSPGRPKGRLDDKTLLAKKIGRQLTLENPAFIAMIRNRIKQGTLDSSMAATLLAYGYGKPKQEVDVQKDQTVHVVFEDFMEGPPASARSLPA